MAGVIDTAAKRARLTFKKNPYWQGISGGRGGLSLGYRPSARGPGSWIAKIVIDGHRIEERIASVSDGADVEGLSFTAATAAVIAWGKRQSVAVEAGKSADRMAAVPTVRLAVEDYVVLRKARGNKSGSAGAIRLHVCNDSVFASTKLAKLAAVDIEKWRSRLPSKLKPSTKDRLLNDLRAALNAAAQKHRRSLPGHLLAEIKIGTKAEGGETAPRRQLLTERQVRSVVEIAFELDQDFGELTILAAATGARFSQLSKLLGLDLQLANRRVMMPSSNKGRNRKPGVKVAIPLEGSVLARFALNFEDRTLDEPLLQRWWHKKAGGPGKWTKDRRGAWSSAYEVEKLWSETVKLASLPAGTVMYALRHSSIVRGLRAGLPVRLVAALHDTSTEMIEKHYSAYIIDMTEDLARGTLMSFKASKTLQDAD